jgi:hypothetical protein
VSARDWYVAPDAFDNATLWERNHERPDYPIALLVRVSSNADLFDGIVELLAAVEETAAHALTIDQERMAAESRARDLEAENTRLRALLAEDVALLEGLEAAWDEAGS